MAVGLHTSNLANKWLDILRGTDWGTEPAAIYVKLHKGDPGATATGANDSSVTTRSAITFAAASSGVLTSNNTPSWATWAGTNGEVVTHVSFWDASTSGNFLWSAALTASKTMGTGDTLNLTSGSTTITLTPLAA